jgi:predicted aspartyl protease
MKIARWIRMPLLCMAAIPTAFGACRIGQIAEIPVSIVYNRPIVDGKINDRDVKILIDTGGAWTTITEDAATQLGLPLDTGTRMRAWGVAGEARVLGTVVEHFQMGSFTGEHLQLAAIGHALDAPHRKVVDTTAMILGEDFLANFTTEFDLAHGVIRLLRPEGCAADQLAYWSDTYSVAELERFNPQHAVVRGNVLVNGRRVLAMFDTGSATSMIALHESAILGVAPGKDGVVENGIVIGVAGNPVQAWTGKFATVTVGDESLSNVQLRIADLFGADKTQETGSRISHSEENVPGMIVGADFFLSHRILVSPKESKLIFTYNGGAPFPFVESRLAANTSAEHADDAASTAAAAAATK